MWANDANKQAAASSFNLWWDSEPHWTTWAEHFFILFKKAVALSWLDFCEILEVNHMSKVLLSIERGMSAWIICGSQVWMEYRQIHISTPSTKKHCFQPQTAPQHRMQHIICSQFWAVSVPNVKVISCNHGIKVLFWKMWASVPKRHFFILRCNELWDKQRRKCQTLAQSAIPVLDSFLLRLKFMYFMFHKQTPEMILCSIFPGPDIQLAWLSLPLARLANMFRLDISHSS